MTKLTKRVKNYNKYPNGLKRKIAKEYLSGKASYGILAEEHGLANKDVVKEFVKWYKRQEKLETSNAEKLKKSGKNQASKSGDLKKDEELEKLRKELELAQLKIEMLETMMDEAEKTLSIDIRKKSGTNQ